MVAIFMVNRCYGPLQLWSSTHMAHILNELGVDIGVGIRLGVGIGLGVGVGIWLGVGVGLG